MLFWLAAILAAGAAAWFVAWRFGLREAGRMGAVLALPFVLTLAWQLSLLDLQGLTAEDRAWARLMVLVSVLISTFASAFALPVWFVMEARIGGAARR